MDTSKQEQQQKFIGASDTNKGYEWSYIRVAEGVTIIVVSATIIGAAGIFLGLVYAGWTLLLNVWHAPAGLVGILAFALLGAVLMLITLAVVIVAWFRRMSSATFIGMMIGAAVGAAIGAAIDSGKWKIDLAKWKVDLAQEQKNAAKPESE
jgi:xanthine/uracil/vitamin C permease (AzgA family)